LERRSQFWQNLKLKLSSRSNPALKENSRKADCIEVSQLAGDLILPPAKGKLVPRCLAQTQEENDNPPYSMEATLWHHAQQGTSRSGSQMSDWFSWSRGPCDQACTAPRILCCTADSFFQLMSCQLGQLAALLRSFQNRKAGKKPKLLIPSVIIQSSTLSLW